MNNYHIIAKETHRAFKSIAPLTPVAFKSGDIVEVQVTFMLVPAKLPEWRMVPTLRCIMLLDGKFAQVRRHARTQKELQADESPTYALGVHPQWSAV